MALIKHRIGGFYFIQMEPVPPSRKRRLYCETRSGVDGYAVWFEAERGEIWRPKTTVDAGSHYFAQDIKTRYEDMVGSVVAVTYANLNYPAALVKDVQVNIVDQVYGIGGFSVAPKALIVADWEILIR